MRCSGWAGALRAERGSIPQMRGSANNHMILGELSRIGIAAADLKSEGPAMGVGVRVPRSPPVKSVIDGFDQEQRISHIIQYEPSRQPADLLGEQQYQTTM